jgi:putative FmdB family regulatory protein
MFYDFKCPSCGNLFEKEKSIRDSSNEKCPRCGRESLRVITGGAGILGGGLSKTPADCSGNPVSCPSAHKCGMGCVH